MHRTLLLTLFALSLSACSFTHLTDRSPAKPSSAVKSDDFLSYQPIAPLPAQNVHYFNGSRYVDKPWASLDDKTKKSLLPIQSSYTYIIKGDYSGDISLLANSASVGIGDYTVISDYILYRVERVGGAGVGLVGVGMRVRAKVKTRKAGLNLGGLFNLAMEAKANNLSGELQVDVIGIYSKDIIQLFPAMTSEISPTSIQQVMQAMAAIKAKISEEGVKVTPQLLAFQQNQPDSAPMIIQSLAYAKGFAIGSRQSEQINAIVRYVGNDAGKWQAIVKASGLDKKQQQAWRDIATSRIKRKLLIEAGNGDAGLFPQLYEAYQKVTQGAKP